MASAHLVCASRDAGRRRSHCDARGALRALLCATALALPTTAGAQYFGRNKVQFEDFDFRVLHTRHFDVHHYVDTEPVVEDMARLAERWQSRLTAAFGHRFGGKKPIILYGSHADFQQTNVTPGLIGEGTGGFTDALRNRVVMPITATYADNEHVLGHELVHVYQYDIASLDPRAGLAAMNQLPLWLIEGMAEYLSLGRVHPHTAMWLRDDVLRGRRPTIEQLTEDARFFPYRYGHALWAYVGGRWGDDAVNRLYRAALRGGFAQATRQVLGVTPEQLSRLWMDATYDAYLPAVRSRTAPSAAGDAVVTQRGEEGAINVSPAVSPDGLRVAFFSGRGLFGIDLYVADARTGRIVRRFSDAGGGGVHFEALASMETAGTWSPDGRKLAFVVFDEGDNAIIVVDVASGHLDRRIQVGAVDAIMSPAWSPDGRRLAFSGLQNGMSDLYLHDLATGRTDRLTSDRYADVQPAWSPDGRTIAFATDRDEATDFPALSVAPLQLALLDVEARSISRLAVFPGAKHINPQFSPDGRDIYFVSDRGGVSDVYRLARGSGDVFQVTRLATGVSGITAHSPAMAVARRDGRLFFSVFERSGYNIYALSRDRARGIPVGRSAPVADVAAGTLPPQATAPTLVGRYLNDPFSGLPAPGAYRVTAYRPSLRLEYLGPPTLGVAVSQSGTSIGGGITASFSDLLGNRRLGAALQTGGSLKDVGGQILFENLGQRWNWGVVAGFVPNLTGFAGARDVTVDIDGAEVPATLVEQHLQRVYVGEAMVVLKYPFSTTRRFETSLGYRGIRYDVDVEQIVAVGDQVIQRQTFDAPAPGGLDFVQGSAAFVADYSIFGPTSPVQGGRYRLEFAPTFGALQYHTFLVDYRRYLFFRPVTFAVRGIHFGRYGRDAEDDRLPPLFLGSPAFVRGYDAASFDPAECTNGPQADGCPEFDRLIGSRVTFANVELRIPLLGPRGFALVESPYLPVEIAPFVDFGVASTRGRPSPFPFGDAGDDRTPVLSAGGALRVKLLGYAVVELFYAKPFQRPARSWVFGLQLAPGW